MLCSTMTCPWIAFWIMTQISKTWVMYIITCWKERDIKMQHFISIIPMFMTLCFYSIVDGQNIERWIFWLFAQVFRCRLQISLRVWCRPLESKYSVILMKFVMHVSLHQNVNLRGDRQLSECERLKSSFALPVPCKSVVCAFLNEISLKCQSFAIRWMHWIWI